MAPAPPGTPGARPGDRQLLGGLMGAVLTLLALGPPLVYFALGYGARASELLTKAEVKAEVVSQFIGHNPELWQYEELRLREMLVRMPVEADGETARIVSARGTVVAQSPRRVGWPSMARSMPLYDAGQPAGRVEVRHSLLDLLAGTALALLAGLASAAVLLSLLRRLMASHERIAAAMAAEQERARVTLQAIADAVIITDAQGRIEYLNPVAERLTQWPLAQARGQALDNVCPLVEEATQTPQPGPLLQALHLGRAVEGGGTLALRRRDGALLAVESSAAPLHDADGALSGGAMVFRDVTEPRRLAQRITWAATHDALTALLNRPEFETRIDAALLSARNSQQQHVLCALDLDRFKAVNDSAGHAAGDALLRQLAQVLQARLRQSDTLARLGGDEFGVLLAGCSMERARLIAAELLAAVRELHFEWQGRSFQVGVSIGLVAITQDSGSRAEIQAAADAALYAAKAQGRDRVCVHGDAVAPD